jgi:hypothetical protein
MPKLSRWWHCPAVGGNEHHIRVLEHPDDLLNADQSSDPNVKQNVKSKR